MLHLNQNILDKSIFVMQLLLYLSAQYHIQGRYCRIIVIKLLPMQLVKIKLKTVAELISLKQRELYLELSANKIYLTSESLITTRRLLSEAIQILVALLNQRTMRSQKYPSIIYQRESENSSYELSKSHQIKGLLSALESIRAQIVIQNNITLVHLRQIRNQILRLIGYRDIPSNQRIKSNSFSVFQVQDPTLINLKRPSNANQELKKRQLKMQLERQMIDFLSNKHSEVRRDKSYQKEIQPAQTRPEQLGTLKRRKQKRFNYLQECERQMREEQLMMTPRKDKNRELPSTGYSSSEKDPLGDELFDFLPAPFGVQSKLDFEKLIIEDSLQQPCEIINEDSLQIMKQEERHENTAYFGEKVVEQEEKQNFSFSNSL